MPQIGDPIIHTNKQIQKIRDAGKLVKEVLNLIKEECKEGITTLELDNIAHSFLKKKNAIGAAYGQYGYPNHCCISIDDIILHGIPNHRIIKNGMLVGIDCPVNYKGGYADAAINVEVGEVSKEKKKINKTAYECLLSTIKLLKPGISIGEICSYQQQYANDQGYEVIKDFGGHGVGKSLHEPPHIPYFFNEKNPHNDYQLQKGNVIALEPTLVTNNKLLILPDGWGVVNLELTVGTSWEHTMLITKEGYEILTL